MSSPTRNGIHKGPDFQGRGVPVIKMGEVYSSQYIDDAERDLFALSSIELSKAQVHEGDLLFCRTSLVPEGVGRCALVRALSAPSVFASNLIRVRINTDLALPQWFHYHFQSSVGRQQIRTIARGTSVTTITGPDLAELLVPLPSLAEQRRIAGVLRALDDLIETNEGLVRDLRKLVGAVLASRQSAHATTHVPLGDVFTFKEGQTSKPASRVTTGGVPIMGANGVIGSSSTANSSQSTVVLGKIGSAGALNVTSGPSWITNNAFEVLPREPWSRELVLALLQQVDFTSCIGGSANPYMPLKNFEHVRITLPSDIGQIASLARTSESAIDELGSEAKELKSTRDDLLPLLMSGRVRVKDVAA